MEVVCVCSHELAVGFGLAGVKNMLKENLDQTVKRINEDKNIGLIFLSEDFRQIQDKLNKPSVIIEDIQ